MLTKRGLKPRASRTEFDFLPVGTALTVRCPCPSGQGLEAGAEGGSAPSPRRARRCGEEEAHGVGGRGGGNGRVEARGRGVKREQGERARRLRSGGVARSAVRDAARARRAPASAQSPPAWAAAQVRFFRGAEGAEPGRLRVPARPRWSPDPEDHSGASALPFSGEGPAG